MSVYSDTLNFLERPLPCEQHKELDLFDEKRIKIGKNLTKIVKRDFLSAISKFMISLPIRERNAWYTS